MFTMLMSMVGVKALANDAMADKTIQFVDKDGKVVNDGAVINIDEGEKDIFGDILIKAGLYVKNVSEYDVYVGIDYEIKSIPNGAFQICFPQNCVQKTAVGKYSTPQGPLVAADKKDIQAEWIPDVDGFGTCSVELQVNLYIYNALTKVYTLDEEGPRITVNLIYNDPVSIDKIVQFVDKTGNVVADGTIINVDKGEIDIFGGLLFPTGLFVENVSENDIFVSIDYEIKSLPNGAFQICFPQSCVQKEVVGKFSTQQGALVAGDKKDIQAEWIPDKNGFGTCTVVFQVNIYVCNTVTRKYVFDKKGPIVTVNINYNTIGFPKCEKPTIGYSNGKLIFKSETEGAEFVSEITDADIKKYYDSEVQLCVTYNISVYATKSGYENSDVATATLCWIDVEPKKEGITDETTDAKRIEATPVLIQSENGRISVSGADDGTAISVFGTNGVKVGAAVSHSGQAIVDTKLPSGSVAIVKIGEKSVKVVVK